MRGRLIAVFLSVVLLAGCATAKYHKNKVQDDSGDRITVGKVQREIRVGMSGAEVAGILGSPNIVSTDAERREVWIYDKVATDATYSKSEGFGTLLLVGYAADSGSRSTTQRTLTIIIKFDHDKLVRDFAYHSSKF